MSSLDGSPTIHGGDLQLWQNCLSVKDHHCDQHDQPQYQNFVYNYYCVVDMYRLFYYSVQHKSDSRNNHILDDKDPWQFLLISIL
jgi:hypothetical protein